MAPCKGSISTPHTTSVDHSTSVVSYWHVGVSFLRDPFLVGFTGKPKGEPKPFCGSPNKKTPPCELLEWPTFGVFGFATAHFEIREDFGGNFTFCFHSAQLCLDTVDLVRGGDSNLGVPHFCAQIGASYPGSRAHALDPNRHAMRGMWSECANASTVVALFLFLSSKQHPQGVSFHL